jgi:Ca-activated chloride channel family protein
MLQRARFLRLSLLWLAAVSIFTGAVVPSTDEPQQSNQDERKRSKPELESRSPQERSQQKGYTIGVSVDLVVVHTTVVDKNGHFISGLKKENFSLYEDGIGQNVSLFSQEDVPISMGIVLDTSGSMRSKIEMVNKSALAFVKASNPDDEVFLIGFNDEAELLEDYTNDIDAITDALDNIIVTGGTALFDATYLGVQKAQTGEKPKKALVVITDGEDRDSYYKLEELVEKVQESDVQIYTIGFLNEMPDKGLFGRWSKSVPEKARDGLQKISEETGAKAFFPKKVSEMSAIVAEIAYELRNQYSIGFVSSNSARDGSYRRIKITLDKESATGRVVRYRKGYFAPKGTSE